MNYYLDTEFLEGPQQKTFLRIKTGMTKPTIDLISIGIVSDDGREYYAISKDFNLKEAWNRFQIKQVSGDQRNRHPEGVKEYWIRENVLKPIFHELMTKEYDAKWKQARIIGYAAEPKNDFSFKNMKRLIHKYGKSNKDIAYLAKHFIYNTKSAGGDPGVIEHLAQETIKKGISFYAYYADYDWVVFCWLFGNMMNLPKGFPMYCIDLKQIYDREQRCRTVKLKEMHGYPVNNQEHSAISDARWNKELHTFLSNL